jgi:serine/threonine protein kinase
MIVAIKIIDKVSLPDSTSQLQFAKEVYFLKCFHHPYFAELFEVFEDSSLQFFVFEHATKRNIYSYISAHGCYF